MSSIFSLSQNDAKRQIVEVFSSDEKFCYSQREATASACYMVTDNLSAVDCLSTLRGQKITSLLQNSIQSLSDKLSFLKLVDYRAEDYFLEKVSLLNSEVITVNFDLQDDRTQIIEQAFHNALLDIDMVKYQYIHQVALELVMNAQIDAPKVSSKTNVRPSVLVVEKNIEKDLVAVSVIDYYGSLDCYKMLENIYAAHKDGFRNSMSKNSIGAGLGSALVYEYADSLFIGVIPGEMSRVTAVLPYGVSEKRVNQTQKSIHIIKG